MDAPISNNKFRLRQFCFFLFSFLIIIKNANFCFREENVSVKSENYFSALWKPRGESPGHSLLNPALPLGNEPHTTKVI
jgi:hypothetical protein